MWLGRSYYYLLPVEIEFIAIGEHMREGWPWSVGPKFFGSLSLLGEICIIMPRHQIYLFGLLLLTSTQWSQIKGNGVLYEYATYPIMSKEITSHYVSLRTDYLVICKVINKCYPQVSSYCQYLRVTIPLVIIVLCDHKHVSNINIKYLYNNMY